MNRLLERIQDTLKANAGITTVSFDIFDTVLFRMVEKPIDIFEIVGKEALDKGCLSDNILPEIYKGLRIEAEKRARKRKQECCGTTEISYKEIFEELPAFCLDKPALMQLEFDVEKRYCYLNPDIHETAVFFQEHPQYKVILVSDMYFSAGQLRELLLCNGFPVDILDGIYVSSESGMNKREGSLFSHVLSERSVSPDAVLHIGDNCITDIVNAEYFGLHTLYYDVISGDEDMGLQLERLKYGQLLPSVASLRRYVADKAGSMDSEEAGWYRIGSLIFGPVMTAFADWIMETAKQEKIDTIYPLMREGMLINKLLQQAIPYCGKNIRTEPMYISRYAMLLPSMEEWNEEAFEKVCAVKRATVASVFSALQETDKEMEHFLDCPIADLPMVTVGGMDGKSYLRKVLFRADCVERINCLITEKKEAFRSYLQKLGAEGRFLTVDLGMKGTMQQALSGFLGEEPGGGIVHLLMFAATGVLEKIMDGVDIRGFVGCAGSHGEWTDRVLQRPYIWEQVMMCNIGTTVGYQQDGSPVTKCVPGMGREHFQRIAWCQDGILDFQREFLRLKQIKQGQVSLALHPQDCAKLVFRMIELPSEQEARLVGKLQFDENNGVDCVAELCPETEERKLLDLGVERYIRENPPGSVMWMEGTVTSIYPAYYLNQLLDNQLSGYDQSILYVVKKVLAGNPEWVVVCGAGEAGRAIRKYLQLFGIKIEAYTDGNVKLQGGAVDGIPVKPLQDVFRTNQYVIASFAYAEEIEQEIRGLKKDPVIYHY